MATVSSSWRFTRSTNPRGFFSTNRASTDAEKALLAWIAKREGRSYEIKVDEENLLIAVLSTASNDQEAGPDLDYECLKAGVERERTEE